MRQLVRLVASVVIGLTLLVPLGGIYGAAGLPVYHSWGLTHGSFTTAIPALVAGTFIALGLIPWFGGVTDALPRILASLSVLLLVTVLFWVNQNSGYSMSLSHLAVYTVLLLVYVALCIRAMRPWLVPLFLLIPLLCDPLFGLAITGSFDAIGLELFTHDLQSSVLPAAAATGLAVVVTRFVRRSEA
jgi:hypothetical protein